MKSPGLAVLPCLWAAWTFIGIITSYSITMFEGHYKTPLMSISDTGAKIPESIVLTIVNTISNLLKVAIMYVMYRLIEIRAAERQICGVISRKLLLALGWTACVGNLVVIYLQVGVDSVNRDPTLWSKGPSGCRALSCSSMTPDQGALQGLCIT
ncbi:DNA damage-regulated autophagy modulator protein 1-like [Rhinoderma darwinii]|uniref:DNA damage-regulated autophagy modulator protein 1-like n=1 Tax=Rhinoderma darwinii TaxID=43563 RepID=UPI003F661396